MTDDAVQVVAAGPGLLLQDLGRPGWAHLGVPPSGALDVDALRLANRLVGNEPGAVGLEILLGGLGLVASRSVRVAVTGADALIEVDGRACPWGESVSIAAGCRLTVTAVSGGIRSWLAVDGGIVTGHDLGSGSTDTLTGLGPEPVRTGATLPLGPRVPRGSPASAVPRPPLRELTSLRVRLGPRADWLTAESLDALTARTYVVAADSDRVGLRLEAADGRALQRSRVDEFPSEGIVTGAVQVPSGGQPLIFLADHPVTGGYPVVAVVDRADRWICAQLRPGDRIRLQTASSASSSGD
ncbi:MAG TPA: biotin-dependent carboxyltransferase family protein [Nocardioidaceae bacterium]|nr:biotin-dependent carboxyltransferase family protein [Nocardioidaceae bacterium]